MRRNSLHYLALNLRIQVRRRLAPKDIRINLSWTCHLKGLPDKIQEKIITRGRFLRSSNQCAILVLSKIHRRQWQSKKSEKWLINKWHMQLPITHKKQISMSYDKYSIKISRMVTTMIIRTLMKNPTIP